MSKPALHTCPWMRRILPQMVEGKRKGIAFWYARVHVERCPVCKKALDTLMRMAGLVEQTRMSVAGEELPPSAWDDLAARLEGHNEEPKNPRGP